MKKLVSILAGLILIIVSISLFAQGRGYGMRGGGNGCMGNGMGGGMGGFFHDQILQDIGVTDSIRKQIREIAFQSKKEMIETQYQIREKKLILHKELLKSNLDEGKINSINQEISELQKNQIQRVEKTRLAIAKLLTPEQREKLSKFAYDRKRHFGGGMRYMDN